MRGESFFSDLGVLNLGGCDVIFGADWMWGHNPITIDLKSKMIKLLKGEREVVLEGDNC